MKGQSRIDSYVVGFDEVKEGTKVCRVVHVSFMRLPTSAFRPIQGSKPIISRINDQYWHFIFEIEEKLVTHGLSGVVRLDQWMVVEEARRSIAI